MFGDRQQLDVGETVSLDVLGQLMGDLAVVEEGIVRVIRAPPRTKVHFVDRDRSIQSLGTLAIVQPLRVVPIVSPILNDDGGRLRTELRLEGVGVGLFESWTAPSGEYRELVPGSRLGHGNK